MHFRYQRVLLPGWSALRSLGHSRALNSSYVWIVLVPIAAKLLERAPDRLMIKAFGSEMEVVLSLPFSWVIFYFASLSFFLANIAYLIGCPEIVKDFRNFSDFLESGGNGHYLLRQEQKYFHDRFYDQNYWKEILRAYVNSKYSDGEIRHLLPKYHTDVNVIERKDKAPWLEFSVNPHFVLAMPREELGNSFSFWQSIVDDKNTIIRALCVLLYAIGFCLLTVVFIQNIVYVSEVFIERK